MPADDYCAAGGLDAAGWVLGALDPGDAERFARHLPTCRACRLTIAELEPVARIFLGTSPEPRPGRANGHDQPVKRPLAF
jgi:anti-sigma factor RsiW